MKIFITGATGVLGRRVVPQLVDSDYQVIGLARSQDNVHLLTRLGATARMGSLFDPEKLIEITADCSAILHLATKIPLRSVPKKKDWELNNRIRTEGTANLIRAAEVNGIDTFIQQSIVFIYGDQQGARIYSETPLPAEPAENMIPNVQMEKLLTEHPSLSFIILRFGFFYAADSAQTRAMIKMVGKRQFPVIGRGDNYFNMIHADDAARAVVHALRHAEELGRSIFNISDFAAIQFKDIIREMAEASQARPPRRIPGWLARMMLGRDAYSFLTSSYQIQEASGFAGWQPKYPSFAAGIREVVREISLNGADRG